MRPTPDHLANMSPGRPHLAFNEGAPSWAGRPEVTLKSTLCSEKLLIVPTYPKSGAWGFAGFAVCLLLISWGISDRC